MRLNDRSISDGTAQRLATAPRTATVALSGDIHLETAPGMVEVVLVCRNSGGVAVDFAYGDLAGVEAVSVLVRARNPLRSDGRGVFVRSPPGLLTRMLDLFGLTDMIERPGAQNNGSSSS